MLYWVIFFIFAGMCTAILFIKVNIVVEFVKDGKNDHFILSLVALKERIKYKYEVPFFTVDNEGIKMRRVKEKGRKESDIGKKRNKVTFSEMIHRYKEYKDLYKRNKIFISDIQQYIKKKFTIQNIDLNINVGTGEAHYTAVLTGILWAVSGSILSFLSSFMVIEKNKICIQANFREKKILVDFYCIFTFKIVHIIVVGIKALSYYVRGKLDFKNKALGGGISG